MNIDQVLGQLSTDTGFMRNVAAWKTIPAREGVYDPFPAGMDGRLVRVLKERGITQLYRHQAQAVNAALLGSHMVVVTPTASGKTLCYNLPVLQSILANPASRALYLFPTKALAQDQVAELQETVTVLGEEIKTFTYDGDTPQSARRAIRSAGHIVVTNPDMLHTGILPHHTKWVKLFENLQYVVIDELHTYRGIFGSHLANLIRRLKRICRFYGSNPQFICSSATIANPRELAEKLLEEPVVLIDENGAPTGSKHFILYNPPVVNKELGIRRSSLLEARKIASQFLRNDVQSIVFTKSRITTELMYTYLSEDVESHRVKRGEIRAYRGGYLPSERRAIERGLRQGDILGVVSTSALELGIDIGQLDACIMVGYPGTVASTWQRAGRAGRRHATSVAVLVGSSSPLDQFLMSNPDYFFNQSPETGLLNPDNLYILVSHIKCAAFELPFEDEEHFGVNTTIEVLRYLEEEQILRHVGNRWHWMSEAFPADGISLRSAAVDNFIIIDTTRSNRVIGEMDRLSAMTMLHDEAIYIHQGQQYHVDKLDWKEKKAYVKAVDVDYYTDANLAVSINVLRVADERQLGASALQYGEVKLTALPTIFKKIKLYTHENIGWGKIHLPEEEIQTTACWLAVPEGVAAQFDRDQLQNALVGMSNLLVNLGPLYLMCDPKDIGVVCEVKSSFTQAPTVYLYDHMPGGVGLAEKLHDIFPLVIEAAIHQLGTCSCEKGCPSCVGPSNEVGEKAKGETLKLLVMLREA